jgi:predicted phage-related endonuclease
MIERHAGARLNPLRAQDLTASDIAAAFGVSPYKTQLALYAEKAGLLAPVSDNPMMRRGRWLESSVLYAIRETYPDWDVRPVGLYLRDPDIRLGATPDYFADIGDGKVTNIQAKIVARPTFTMNWSAGAPLGYQLQTITENMMLEAEQGYIAALVIDAYSADLEMIEVPRNPAIEERIRQMAVTFWENIANGVRPVADPEKDAETVAALFPVSVPEPVLDLSGDNRLADILPVRDKIKADISALEKALKTYDTEIKDKLGEAEKATLPGWSISWPTIQREERVTPAGSYRRLTITKLKEEAI